MRIEDLLKRLRREYFKLNILQSVLDGLILVLGFNLLAFVLKVSYDFRLLALAGGAFALVDFLYRVHGYSVEIYETENSEIREMLRTARDNLDKTDTVSEALFNDVMDRARKVSSESIVPSEKIVQKLLIVGGLSILTTVSGLVMPALDDGFDNVYDQVSDFVSERTERERPRNTTDELGESADLEGRGSDIEIDIVGEGESFEESVLSGFQGNASLMYEASPEIDGNEELMREYSVAIQDLE